MQRITPVTEDWVDDTSADPVHHSFEEFIWFKQHRCPLIVHLAWPVEPRPERAFRIHLVEAGSGRPLAGALIWTDWGTVGGYEEKVADHEGNAQLHMSQFHGPCKDLTKTCFDLWIHGFLVGKYEVSIGDDVEIEVLHTIVRAASSAISEAPAGDAQGQST